MIKVGLPSHYKTSESGRQVIVKYTYKDIDFDARGWADATKFIPKDFDLVSFRLQDGKYICGWHTGTGWDGYKLKDEDVILKWRRIMEDKKQKKIDKKKNKCKAVLQ